MNITVYGDSILKGVLLEDGKYRIEHRWERSLAALYGLVIKNCSRFGSTLEKALSLIRRDADKKYDEGEVAVLEFGGNDCDYDWAAISAEPDGIYDCKTPPEKFRRMYREAIDLVRGSGRRPVVLTLPPVHSERYLEYICRGGLSSGNILHWLGDVNHIYRWQAKYSHMARRIAEEKQAELIDVRRAFITDSRGPDELTCDDGIHPSYAGQQLIYETISAALT